MKGVIRSLPRLQAAGFEIEIWCWRCDVDFVWDRICLLPRFGNLPIIGSFVFSWMVSVKSWWRYQLMGQMPPEVIYSVAGYLAKCDVCHVHFSPFDWERRQGLLGIHSLRDFAERVINFSSLYQARRFLQTTTAKTVICVSDAVANDTQQENQSLQILVLPNSFDPMRFHAGVKAEHREQMRLGLGYQEPDQVFVFVSTGHYRRKGFFLALEAIKKLHLSFPEIRLLVVGGTQERLGSLKEQIGQSYDWLKFTGSVPDVENYFAAADAFLFPSYSEAFALVEVEAAACGLPLFLTPHHGSEMILEDGVNGRFVGFDVDSICQVLRAFMQKEWVPQSGIHLKKALDVNAYADRLTSILLHAASSKKEARCAV
ncbi:MAG: glycosyltransferase family 4 protein [Verrucomicrobia bacterium]|nr:glycosyltransferase family 4 protein [Verrucomicrobiota bacterium]